MALNIEKFDPNIKSPGINKATGAYARGDVAGVADWTVVSKNIQDSINEAGKVIAADLQEAKTLTDNLMAAKDDAQLAIDKFGEQNINSFTNATDDILSSVKSDMQTDTDRLTKSRKGFLGIGERDERDEGQITFKDLTRRQKKEALDRLNNLKLLKQNVEAPLTNWTTNDPADLNWANIAKNPKAKEFYHHLIVEGGKYDVSFTNEKGEKSTGGYIKYEVDGETKYLSNIELAGAKEMFTGAGELKESVFSVLDENAKLISGDATRFQQDNNIEDFNYKKNINMKVDSMLADKANYEFIFNNLTDPKNREIAYTGSEEQVAEVKDYMYQYISDKVGQERTEKTPKIPPGNTGNKVAFGGGSYDSGLLNRVKQLYDETLQPLSEKRLDFSDVSTLPPITTNDIEGMIQGGVGTEVSSKGKQMANERWFRNIFSDQGRPEQVASYTNNLFDEIKNVNNIVDKEGINKAINEGVGYKSEDGNFTLSENDAKLLREYQNYQNSGFDQEVELKQFFNTSGTKYNDVQYYPNSQIVKATFTDGTKAWQYNLGANEAEWSKFANELAQAGQGNREEINQIFNILKRGGTKEAQSKPWQFLNQ